MWTMQLRIQKKTEVMKSWLVQTEFKINLVEVQDQNDEIVVILMFLMYDSGDFIWLKVGIMDDKTVYN